MVKIFIGQRVSDENIAKLREEIKKIYLALEEAGHKAYCTLDEEDSAFEKASDWLMHAFKEIEKYDAFLAIIRSEERSEGLLMEIGHVLSKKMRFILAINKKVKDTYLKELTEEVIEFSSINDLCEKLKQLK